MKEQITQSDEAVAGSLLLLTTKNRYSGESETTLLTYRKDGDFYVVAARNETEFYKPEWYLNLKEEPLVSMEVAGKNVTAKAVTPVGAERLRLWPLVESLAAYDPAILPRDTALVTLLPLG